MAEQAGAGDRSEWLELVKRVADSFPGLDMESYAATLDRNIARGTALLARRAGRVAGVLLFSPRLRCLSCMAVLPEFRRQGVASELMSEMLRLMPPGDVSVTTFREGDPMGTAPRALYRRFGFEPGELEIEFDYPVQRMTLRGKRRGG